MAESPTLWTPSNTGEDPMSILGNLVENLKPWLGDINPSEELRLQPAFRLSQEQRFLGELALQQLSERVHELHDSDEVNTELQGKLEAHCASLYYQGAALGEQIFPVHATIIVEAYSDFQEALRYQPRPGEYL